MKKDIKLILLSLFVFLIIPNILHAKKQTYSDILEETVDLENGVPSVVLEFYEKIKKYYL